MDAAVKPKGPERPLELLGIGATEERVYRILLGRHAATVVEVAGQMGCTRRMARTLLADLESLGLATHTLKVPRVYLAAPPEFALAALIKQRQAMLERVRVVIPDLEDQSARSSSISGNKPVLEVITSHSQLGLVLAQMYKSFRSEVMCFQRAPVLVPAVDPPRKTRVGASVRTISDNSMLEVPGMVERLKDDAACGEQARTLSALPFKMMVFDRRAAVISLDDGPERALALLIHGKVLLQALCLLFEFAWEHATPITFGNGHSLVAGIGDTRVSGVTDALVPLLAAGLNDKAIAIELGISSSTLNRRMSELMRATGTRTRFQLGWRLALDAAPATLGNVLVPEQDECARACVREVGAAQQ